METATKIIKKYVILQFSSVYFDSIQKHLKSALCCFSLFKPHGFMEYWLPWKPKKKKDSDFKSGKRLNKMSFSVILYLQNYSCVAKEYSELLFLTKNK